MTPGCLKLRQPEGRTYAHVDDQAVDLGVFANTRMMTGMTDRVIQASIDNRPVKLRALTRANERVLDELLRRQAKLVNEVQIPAARDSQLFRACEQVGVMVAAYAMTRDRAQIDESIGSVLDSVAALPPVGTNGPTAETSAVQAEQRLADAREAVAAVTTEMIRQLLTDDEWANWSGYLDELPLAELGDVATHLVQIVRAHRVQVVAGATGFPPPASVA